MTSALESKRSQSIEMDPQTFYYYKVYEWITENKKNANNSLYIPTKSLYWFPGSKSKICIENKLVLYKVLIEPIWTYGIEL